MARFGMRDSLDSKGWGRLSVVLFLLFGYLASLSLQSWSLPMETPRQAMIRLTGVDIAPVRHVVAHDAMEMAGGHVMMGMHHHGHHHEDGSCPLCPLLHLEAAAFLSYSILLSVLFFRWRPVLPRLEQAFRLVGSRLAVRPFQTGPPVLF